MKYRCPICNGTGAVEPAFGSGWAPLPGQSYTSAVSSKVCPGCDGSGMQEVADPVTKEYHTTTRIIKKEPTIRAFDLYRW